MTDLSGTSGLSGSESIPQLSPSQKEKRTGFLSTSSSEEAREVKEISSTKKEMGVDALTNISQKVLSGTPQMATEAPVTHKVTQEGKKTAVEQRVEASHVSVLGSEGRDELQRLKQDWGAKEKARIDLQKAHPESLDAIMEAKKLEMDAYLTYMEGAKHFRGAVLIQKQGIPLFSKGYGPSDVEGVRNTDQTRFCIASLTKQFTAMAVALLMDKPGLVTNPEVRERLKLDQGGKLKLTTPINDLLPSKYQNSKWDGITVEHLLRHSSGLSDYGADPADEKRGKNFELEDLMQIASEAELLFTPGEMHCYSNNGYTLLGAIIENLGQSKLEPFMQQHIFTPLQMQSTGMLSTYDEHSVASGFYETEEKNLRTIPMERHLSKTYASGSIISTAEDLGVWDRALFGNGLGLSSEMKDKMTQCLTPMVVYDPHHPEQYQVDEKGRAHPKEGEKYRQESYGFGVMLLDDGSIYHAGKLPGFKSSMSRYPASAQSLTVLTNHDDDELSLEVSNHLEQILFA